MRVRYYILYLVGLLDNSLVFVLLFHLLVGPSMPYCLEATHDSLFLPIFVCVPLSDALRHTSINVRGQKGYDSYNSQGFVSEWAREI